MGDIGMIKGGACLVAQTRRVVVDVVDHRGISSRHGVYRREDREETGNTRKHMHNMTTNDPRRVLTQCYAILAKGETSGKVFAVQNVCQTNEPEGKCCMFAMLGMCGKRTDRVFGFVSLF